MTQGVRIRRLSPVGEPPSIPMNEPTRVWKALVVGGVSSFIKQTIQPKLASFSIGVQRHWDIDNPLRGDIPSDCDLVIVFTEMTPDGSRIADRLKESGEKRGILVIRTSRKLSHFQSDLQRHGFKQQPPDVARSIGSSVVVTESAAPADPLPEEQPMPLPTARPILVDHKSSPDNIPDDWDSQLKMLKELLKKMKKKGLKSFMLDGPDFTFRREIIEDSGGSIGDDE